MFWYIVGLSRLNISRNIHVFNTESTLFWDPLIELENVPMFSGLSSTRTFISTRVKSIASWLCLHVSHLVKIP